MTEQDKLKKLIKSEVFIAIQRAFPSCIDEECVKKGIADKHEAAAEATDSILFLLAAEIEKARKLDQIANLISAFPSKQKYPQIMEAINLLREIEGIVKEANDEG